METTCGIFLFLRNGKLLVGHVTNSGNKWSIPKGLPDDKEEFLDAAKREMFEETNVNYDKLDILHVAETEEKTYKNGKKKLFSVAVYTNNKEEDFDLKCHSLVNDDFPEIDGYKFVTIEEALQMEIQDTQKEVLEYLLIRRKKFESMDNHFFMEVEEYANMYPKDVGRLYESYKTLKKQGRDHKYLDGYLGAISDLVIIKKGHWADAPKNEAVK